MRLSSVVVAGVVSWVAAPWIGMARHGTVDQRTVAAWRVEPRRSPAEQLLPHLADVVPAQRVPDETTSQPA